MKAKTVIYLVVFMAVPGLRAEEPVMPPVTFYRQFIQGKPTEQTSTHLSIWHPDGRIRFGVMIVNEPSPDYALRVLGGIRFTGDRMDPRRASTDIERVCKELKAEKPNKGLRTTNAPVSNTTP